MCVSRRTQVRILLTVRNLFLEARGRGALEPLTNTFTGGPSRRAHYKHRDPALLIPGRVSQDRKGKNCQVFNCKLGLRFNMKLIREGERRKFVPRSRYGGQLCVSQWSPSELSLGSVGTSGGNSLSSTHDMCVPRRRPRHNVWPGCDRNVLPQAAPHARLPVIYPSFLFTLHRSTDFEVHRNWLAVASSLPVDRWYVDQTSPWTLDYPPLFACFELLLAQVARFFDAAMLDVKNLNYASPMTILFQRLSVIVTDLVYAYGCRLCGEEVVKAGGMGGGGKKGVASVGAAVAVVLFTNAGLLLVDHIHFQYNGFLFGVLFLSIAKMLQRKEIQSAIYFSVLLNLKHIYLYLAPAYFIYLLRSYVLLGPVPARPDKTQNSLASRVFRLIKLGAVVVLIFGLSFGPFIAKGQLQQVLTRLFPFKRGLCHAYWAPNFWALYNIADKLLVLAGGRLGWAVGEGGVASMTGGLVQEYSHAVLPSVSPGATLVVTALSILPSLIVLWRSPNNPWQFVRAVVMCGFGSFMFGWHVHEKAVLMVVLPLGLLCLLRKAEAQVFVFLSAVGHFSLFPLFFTPQETPIKVTALLLHALFTLQVLRAHWGQTLLNTLETLYLLGLVPLSLLLEVGAGRLGLGEGLPFLPLMAVSVYCALGVTYSWVKLSYLGLVGAPKLKRKTN
ncbi:putative dolichyl pyrophosphate Glc1Man9GlcNAc2 alpha-1,3-glucosyltransferase [Chionoecetes opilio]|uniref:Alpha-1,3-glucosyltransferase n=1 Tax=Chionoecetes opilio TaxID=41210 RepID=A0A8J5CNX3_CHIOP|nr:putative dolichyl pyrophosphate Glc1Man9GlcNAc2 alpha-1,3-glucosyltransferase [Chionoecetes opilio]